MSDSGEGVWWRRTSKGNWKDYKRVRRETKVDLSETLQRSCRILKESLREKIAKKWNNSMMTPLPYIGSEGWSGFPKDVTFPFHQRVHSSVTSIIITVMLHPSSGRILTDQTRTQPCVELTWIELTVGLVDLARAPKSQFSLTWAHRELGWLDMSFDLSWTLCWPSHTTWHLGFLLHHKSPLQV